MDFIQELRKRKTVREKAPSIGQQRVIDALKKHEGITWFGARSAKAIEALEKAGLVTSTCHVQVDAVRGRHKLKYLVKASFTWESE